MIFRVHALENLVHAGNAAQDLCWVKKATKLKTVAGRSLVIEYEYECSSNRTDPFS